MQTIAIDDLDFDDGATILIKHALHSLPGNERLGIRANSPELAPHLLAWCRNQGHVWYDSAGGREDSISPCLLGWIEPGTSFRARWQNAQRAGKARFAKNDDGISAFPPAQWGLAARGALVEDNAPAFHFPLSSKGLVWTDDAPKLYAQAIAAQWNPDSAVDWNIEFDLPDEIEEAVVQIMTYLVENENAALMIPARFLSQIHPHFREVVQLLALQVGDEARHVEVFTRRMLLKGKSPGFSTAGGQTSLKTLVETPSFETALFLLSVLGEGTFVNLLSFLHEVAPDPITQRIARLTMQDEARHVAFGMAHLQYQLQQEPDLRARLASAIERRFESLTSSEGLNEEVFDALVILAAGSWEPKAIRVGVARVRGLQQDMASGRKQRLIKLGFPSSDAERLAQLHTQNFM